MKNNAESEMSNLKPLRVLMIEDSEDDALLIIRELKKGGYDPVYERVETAAAIKKALKEKPWDIILCDYKLPKFSGLQALALLKKTNIYIPIIIVSGTIGEDTAVECMRLGAQDYIMKDNLSRLCPAIARELGEAEVRNKRQQAENALRESEEKYRNLVDRANDGIGIAQDGILHYVNTKLVQMGGYSAEELTGKPFTDFFAPEEVSKVLDRYKQRMAGKKVAPIYETALRHKNGNRIEVEVNAGIITYEGKPADLVLVRDISERKLAESQRAASLKELQESEEKYRNILQNIEDGYCEVDLAGNFTFFNDSACQIWGYSKEELMGMNYRQYTDAENAKKLFQTFTGVYKTEEPSKEFDWQIIRKDGTKRYIEVSVSLQRDSLGNPIGFRGITRDITDRKRSEEKLADSEIMYRTLVGALPSGITVSDLQGRITFVSPSAQKIFGLNSTEDATGRNVLEFIAPEDRDKAIVNIQRLIQERKVSHNQYTLLKNNGNPFPGEIYSSVITDVSGKPTAIIGATQDITEQKEAQEELRTSEEKYRTILETMQEGYYEADLAGNTTFVNRALCRVRGYSREELIGRNNQQYTTPEVAKETYKIFHEVYETEVPLEGYAQEIIRKDGEKRFTELSIALRKDKSGKKVGFSGIIRDITDRKQAESQMKAALEALGESEENFRRSLDNSPLGIRIVTAEGETLYANQAALDIYDYKSIEELRKTPLKERYTPESYVEFHIRKEKRGRGELGPAEYEISIIRKNGEIRQVQVYRKEVIWNGAKQYQVIYRDITEQKRAEKGLQKSEKQFKTLFMSMGEGFYLSEIIYDDNGNPCDYRYLEVNPRFEQIMGLSREQIVGKRYKELVPVDTTQWLDNYCKVARTGEPNNYEFYSNEYHLYFETYSYKSTEGQITVFVRDITERKHAEEELYKKHEELQTMIESSPIMIYFKDTKNRFLRVNKAVLEASGLTKEEIEGKTNEEINPKMAATLWEEDKKIIATGQPLIGNIETIKTRRGSKVLQTDKVPYRDKEGNIIGIVGFSMDITEQNKAQEELLRSEEKYRGLIENSQEGIYQSTAEGRHLALNPAFARMLGYDSPEDVMQTITDIARQLYVNPEDRKKLIELVNEKGSIKDFEAEFYKKDGSRIWVSINMHAVRDDEGRLLYYQGIDQDITERKKMEAERQENVERLRKSLGATINAMAVTVETRDPYTAGHQRRVADLARAIAVEMNLTSEQIDGVRMASMIHDIGKISIPSEILTKPTQLTNLEFNLIKTHPVSGYNILKDIEFPWPIARIVQEHHERIDGSGYPNGLKGEQILLESKIIAVADVVEAISSHRPYRAAFGIDVGLDEITKNKGILYDPDVVDVCLRLFREKNYNLAA